MRTKEDKCLICLENDSTKKGSHLMPAGLSAPCDAGRNKEELYFISETINVFYGSNNFKNNNKIQDTTRHVNYNVMDFIFCPNCEKKLSVIESAIIPFLTKVVKSEKGFKTKGSTKNGLVFKDYLNIDLAELKLFFYSVIWRLGLAQELNFGTNVFTSGQYEKLRNLLHVHLSNEIKTITGNKEILNELPLTIITSNFPETSMNIYSPHRVNNNPPLFMACEYLLFIHFNEHVVLNPNFRLPFEVFNRTLINKDKSPVRIGFIENDEWYAFLEKEFRFKAKEFQEVRIQSLINEIGKDYEYCKQLLHKKTFNIQVDQLMKKLNKTQEECIKLYSEGGEKLIHENHLKGYAFSFDDAYIELLENKNVT